ncbi:MAG: heterodisulfide reductase subunit A-like protein [Caldisericum exile]|uniref:Heterodisulfide reductase subunit A-like protein n=1 Tax=Caldisericum exile TaxID=693075 RepID=A0A2J6XA72_9BACT|nr:MAG: heterodisulfide reductase subunit A-like protein [Caldisericum exile]
MAKIGLLLCVCQGICPSFHKMDIFEVLNSLRREGIFEWVGLHPQLCSDDGDKYLRELLNCAQIDQLYVAGCDPTMQKKMYRDAFEAIGFPKEKHIGVEIRNMDTQQAINAIKKAVEENK